MRCREAKLKLTVLSKTGQGVAQDKQLQEHLRSCPGCAREAEAARELRRAFAEISLHDEVDRIGWPEQVRRVEALAARTKQNQLKEKPIMSTVKKQFKLRPRLSLGLAAAVLILIAGTVIPLKFDRTVGFEVAVAGVDRDLALNQDRLNEMLQKLGLEDVRIDIKGCEATCNLVVSELGSEDDAQMVMLAFEEIGKDGVHVQLKVVREGVSGSAVGHALHNIWVSEGHFGDVDTDELHQIVLERLGSEFTGESAIFFGVGEDGAHKIEIISEGLDGSEHEFTWISDADGNVTVDDNVAIRLTVGDDVDGRVLIKKLCFTTDGMGGMEGSLIGPDDIVDGQLTDEARARLEADGWQVEVSEDGTTLTFSRSDGSTEEVIKLIIKSDDDGAATKQAEMPEGYALSQNYPNPFNPDTQIDFTIPQSQHVVIEIYNIRGQKVRTLLDETISTGQHTVTWDATSDSGEQMASGIYLYRFSAGEVVETRKMSLIK